MRLRQLSLSSEFISTATITLLLVLVPGWAVSAAPQSPPVASAALVTEGAPSIVLDDDSDSVGRVGANALSHRYGGRDRTVDRASQQQDIYDLQGISVTKTVTPAGLVEDGDTLTYTLVISAIPGVQVNLYDPLTDTTFVRFVEHPPTGLITYTAGVITGTLTVTPSRQVTVSFAVLVDLSGTLARGDGVANRACIIPSGETLTGCVWSNEVINLVTHSLYLPLALRSPAPVQADFLASPTAGMAPLTVVFTNTSVGGYETSLWDFGDAITSTEASPTHTYTIAGTYTVTLTVSGPDETDMLTRSNYITVSRPLTCVERIANGGFEEDTDWELPVTEYPATFTTAITHSGNRAMRVGIIDPADNRYSYSSARQLVTIPSDVISAALRFWLYPLSGEPSADLSVPARPLAATIEEAVLSSDRQYVLVLNEYNQWINTLIWQRTNDREWTSYEFDLSVYAGRTIKLQFGAYNDGWDGVTAMYVDDVSLEVCASATFSNTPPAAPSHLQATPISSSQIRLDWQDNSSDETGFTIYDGITMTLVEADTTSYAFGGLASSSYHCFIVRAFNEHGNSDWSDWACTTILSGTEVIANGGFEDDGDWVIPVTEYPATYTTAVTHTGSRSMRTGIVELADNRYSYSSVRQAVTIPADTISATLRFWLYPVSGETPANLTLPVRPLGATVREAVLASDRQYVLVLNEYDQWIGTLVWQRLNDQQWMFHELDLTAFAGQSIKLQFGVYNDGEDSVTAMYVDDVSLEVSRTSPASHGDFQRHSDNNAQIDCGGCSYGSRYGQTDIP